MTLVQKPKDIDKEAFIKKAKTIYHDHYQTALEKTAKGKFAAIEVDSEECFVGDTWREAYYNAKKKHFDKFFYFIKIGYKGVKLRKR